jgi:hypothetical protein
MARCRVQELLAGIRQYLTPQVWKQAHQVPARPKPAKRRWDLQPLVLTLLTMTWCYGDSQAERFETAKAFCAVARTKRRRPGRTVQGFQKALARLPFAALRALAAGVRRRLSHVLDLVSGGLIVFGCDGSSLDCPRTEELERRLDPPRRKRGRRGPPQVWLTALVHLRTGVPWAWRFGRGRNRERRHLRALLPTLPARSLVVADAGFDGYELARTILARGASFLIRMSGNAVFYVEKLPGADFEHGVVWLWPNHFREAGRPPLVGRLLRFRGERGQDVWLFTNILEERRLPRATAEIYYHWRWENEGFFRTYKRTLAKVKLVSRTVRAVHREAEGAMLATQLLLANGAEALQPWAAPGAATGAAAGAAAVVERPRRCSPREVLREIRRLLYGLRRGGGGLRRRLATAGREQRPQRRSGKVKRPWPSRAAAKKLKPPNFLRLPARHKPLWDQLKPQAA